MNPKAKRIADEARRKRDEARARGDLEEAKRFDAMERAALRTEEGGAEPIVGSGGRTA